MAGESEENLSTMRVLNVDFIYSMMCAVFMCPLDTVQVRPSSIDLSKCYAIVILVLSILYNYMWASVTSFKGADPQVITIYMHISIFDSFPTI